ncbi:radical SAM protein [Euzebya tangerina]|uniref:radical SAM protein n=1 Tax=Euzebya tangerina TaxID=591198 RepID=UPI000E3125F4|nr:radical SAM protein [Euzebya tangerina]
MPTLAELQRAPDAPADPPPGLRLPLQRATTVDTPAFRGLTFLEVETKSALNKVSGMPFGWSINPYRGCSHACVYCFARPTHEYLNLTATTDFDTKIVVKTNIVEVLARELARPSWKGEHVALGTNVDPYQRAEGRYELMPGIIRALTTSWTPFSILTKGTLITRDTEGLRVAAEKVGATATLTIGMLDEEVWRQTEPGTPSPRARLEAVARLNASGIPTGVMLAPIMPGLNDDPGQLAAVTEAAVEAGATHVTPITLHLRPKVKEAFWPWLVATYPNLLRTYEELYGQPQARGRATLPEDAAAPLVSVVRRTRAAAWTRHGRMPDPAQWPRRPDGPENPSGHTTPAAAPSAARAEQLSLLP